MKKKILEYKAMRRALSFLLAFSLTLGSLPFTSVEVEAQENFNLFKKHGAVQPVKAIPLYEGGGIRGQLVLDTDGYVWGNTTLSGAKDSTNTTPAQNTPLNRVRGINKPIRDIDSGRFGFNLAVSTDNKTLYIFGSNGNRTLGGAATKVNDNVYKYDFYDKQGVTIVDIAASEGFGYVVDSNGDIWGFGDNWDSVRGGTGNAPNKFAGKNFTLNYAQNTNGTLDGTFNRIEAPEGVNSQWPTFVATTTTGEIFVWGYDYGPGRGFSSTNSTTGSQGAATANTQSNVGTFNQIFGTVDANNKPFKRGVPIEIDNSAIIAAEGGSLTSNTPYKDVAAGRGAFLVTQKGNVFYMGATGYIDYGMASGLGNTFGLYGGNGRFAYTPQRITTAFDVSQASNQTPSLDVTTTQFIAVETAYGGSTLLDVDGNVYQVGENWQTSTDTATPDNYTWFKKYTPKTTLLLSGGTALTSGTRKVVGIGTSRQATDYIVYDSSNKSYSAYAAGYEGGKYAATYATNPETAKIDFIQEGLMFNSLKGTGNVTKSGITGSSVLDSGTRYYSTTGSDQAGVTPSLQLEVTMNKEESKDPYPNGTVAKRALSMHDITAGGHNSNMRYVVLQPDNISKYGDVSYYDLAIRSLHVDALPTFLKSKAADTPAEISEDMFEQMFADPSITEKGKMSQTYTAGVGGETKWKTDGSVSGNSIVVALAKTTRNGLEFTSSMAFPIDNYYKQTKSYYKGVATTNAFAGTINIFGAKTVPGQYGVMVDPNNQPITTDGSTYAPANGIDTTPDLSTYATAGSPGFSAAGSYLTSTAVSPKLKFWAPDPATKNQTKALDLNTQDYSVLSGDKIDVNNTLTYNYGKIEDNWDDAKIIYGYSTGDEFINIGNGDSVLGGQVKDYIDNTATGTLQPGLATDFWPQTTGKYSDAGDVFTPAPLNGNPALDGADIALVGYKIGTPPTSETDYIKCSFAYDPLTGKFDFDPIVPPTGSNDLYIVYKSNSVSLNERYLNGDAYAKANQDPALWNYSSPAIVTPLKMDVKTTTTTGAAVQPLMGFTPTVGSTGDKNFYEIDRVVGGDGLTAGGSVDNSYLYKNYFTRQAAVTSSGSIAKYERPYTSIVNHILVGYFDEAGDMHNFWNADTKDFSNIPSTLNTKNGIAMKTDMHLVYLTDANNNGIPDVMEGSVEERWVAITASGSKVLMNRQFTTGYKAHETFTSYETNFDPGNQWIYKSTTITTNGTSEGSESGNEMVAGLPFVDEQPTMPDSTPAYSGGKYSYLGTSGYKTVTYYYNEDSNENKVIDILEPIKVTVKGVDKQGKELYSWPLESSYSESAFTIDAMKLPTFANFVNPTLEDSGNIITDITPSQVTVNPSLLGKTATEADRNITITFLYEETLSTLTVNQKDLAGNLISTYKVTVDYTKPYNTVVPAIKGYTFNQAKTDNPLNKTSDLYTESEKATIPTYSNGKLTFINLAKDGTTDKNVMDVYYSKDTGNITIYAVDIDTISGTPIIIGSTTNRTIASVAPNNTFDPSKAESDPEIFEIPAISNYDLKSMTGVPAFDSKGVTAATTQTFDGTTPLKAVYYFYTRKTGAILAQAVLEDGTPITDVNGEAVVQIYDSEVGQTEIITPPVNSALRNYVLVGLTDVKNTTITGGTSTSVYVSDNTETYNVKFIYRPLGKNDVTNITYVDRTNDGEYNTGDYLISQRVLNMLESEKVNLTAPGILSYKFEESYAYGRGTEAFGGANQKLTIPKSNAQTVNVDANVTGTVYFRYSTLTSNITLTAQSINDAGTITDISALIPAGSNPVKASTGLEYIAYAPHIEGYYLTGAPQQNLGVITGDMTTSPFIYAPLEDAASNYMAKVKIRGINVADDDVLYEYEVYASKGKDYTATSVELPTYKVLDVDNTTELPGNRTATVNVAYNETTKAIDFYYKSQTMEVTAYYWDDVNKTFFLSNQKVDGATLGNSVTENAAYAKDYYYVGYSYTKPALTGTAAIESSDPLAKIDAVDLNNNSIYFIYRPLTGNNIRIFYVEDDGTYDGTDATAKAIITSAQTDANKVGIFGTGADNITATDVTKNISYVDYSSIGYKLSSKASTSQTITYNASTATYEVYFVYEKQFADVTITANLFKDETTPEVPATRDLKPLTNKRVAESIVIEPPYVAGYYTTETSKTITLGGVGADVQFKYIKWPQQTVTVVAKEQGTGKVLSSYTVTGDIGAPVYLKPTKLIGWTLATPTDETVNTTHLIKDAHEEITYYYVADNATLNIEVYEDTNGDGVGDVDIKGKLPGVKLSFTTPNSKDFNGNGTIDATDYSLAFTAYAPNIPKYVLVDPSKYKIDFDETNKGTTYRFVYKSIDNIAVDHMAKVTVRGEYKDRFGTTHELYSYEKFIPLNTPSTINFIQLDGYELKTGQTTARTVTPVRSGEVGTVNAGIQTFVYESTAGEVTIYEWDDTTNTQISKTVKRDSTIGTRYTVASKAIDGKYYTGYTLDSPTGTRPLDASGRVKTIYDINPVEATGHTVYFHYKEITDGLVITYLEETEDGIREILTTYGGQPGSGPLTVTAETDYTDGQWNLGGVDAPKLKDILKDDHYTLVTGDSRYPESQTITIDNSTSNVQRIYFLYKKETKTVRAQLYNEDGTAKITESGAYRDWVLRVGEYTTVIGPDTVNYVSSPRSRGVFVTDTTTEVKFTAQERTSTTVIVNKVNKNATDATKKVFSSYTIDILQGQVTNIHPKNEIGWKLTSSAAVTVDSVMTTGTDATITGGDISELNFEYVPNVQIFNVKYQYKGTDLGTDTFEAPRYDAAFNMTQYNDLNVYAKSFPGYILVATEDPVKTYGIDKHTSDGSAINVVFQYVKITDVLDEYTIKVNVKGVGTDSTNGGKKTLYEYTLTYPEFTDLTSITDARTSNVIKTQTVPDRYFYKDTVFENSSNLYTKDTDYTFNVLDANTNAVTLLRTYKSTIGQTDGVINITFNYDYIPLGNGFIHILAVSPSENNKELSRNTFETTKGTRLSGTAPTIKGYTLVDPSQNKKEGVVQDGETSVVFTYKPLDVGSATVNFVTTTGQTIKPADTINGIVASETTNYLLPDTFVYPPGSDSARIYTLASMGQRQITLAANDVKTATYVDAGPAKVTIQIPGGSNTVYVDKPIYVEKIVEKITEVVRYENERPVQPITTGKLIVGDRVGYVSGYVDGTFKPNQAATRAEVAAMFYTLTADPNKANRAPSAFKDVKDKYWYSQAVNYLAQEGMIAGYTDGTFRPEETITRAEFAAMASRFDDLTGAENETHPFPDVTDGHWANNAIAHGYDSGWIGGLPNGKYQPNNNITRAEVVRIINCMVGRANKTIYTQADNIYKDVTTSHWAFQEIMEARRDR